MPTVREDAGQKDPTAGCQGATESSNQMPQEGLRLRAWEKLDHRCTKLLGIWYLLVRPPGPAAPS
eukprot:2172867-Alexandrium_andersonii.AAC.1